MKKLLIVSALALISFASNAQKPDPLYEVKDVEVQPQYPGGIAAFFSFLKENIPVPADSAAAYDGNMMLSFKISKEGKVNDVHLTYNKKEFVTTAKNIEAKMPVWTPAKIKGKPVDLHYTVAPHFKK